MPPPDDDGATTCSDVSTTTPNDYDLTYDHLNCLNSGKSDTSPSTYYSYVVSDTNSEKLLRIVLASIKGFSIGAGLKGGLSIFSLLARLSRRKSSKLIKAAKWKALLAGAIAGPSMLLTGHNTQHNSLAIYILMRASVLASRCGIKSKRFGHICKPLTWAHGDLCLCEYLFLLYQVCLPIESRISSFIV